MGSKHASVGITSYVLLCIAFAVGAIVFLPTRAVIAAPLAKIERNGISVNITEVAGGVNVQVSPATPAKAEVFALSNPGRLVIDLPGSRFQRTEPVSVLSNKTISGLRLGSHADKARIVIDMASDDEPMFSVDNSQSILRIKLATASADSHDKISEITQAVPQPMLPTQPAKVPTLQPTPLPTRIAPTHTPAPTTTAIPTIPRHDTSARHTMPGGNGSATTSHPVETIVMKGNESVDTEVANREAMAPSKSGQTLQAILFERHPESGVPIIKLRFSDRPRFLMTKSSERAYRIVVPEVTLQGSQLALPFFPPHDFSGFTVVRAEVKAKDIEIMIGVERGGKITPTTRDNEIWVEANMTQ